MYSTRFRRPLARDGGEESKQNNNDVQSAGYCMRFERGLRRRAVQNVEKKTVWPRRRREGAAEIPKRRGNFAW